MKLPRTPPLLNQPWPKLKLKPFFAPSGLHCRRLTPLAIRSAPYQANVAPTHTPHPRRIARLASQPLNTTVRPSKKGEVLAMKKLGISTKDDEAKHVTEAVFDKFLKTTMQQRHFDAPRDIFPAREAAD